MNFPEGLNNFLNKIKISEKAFEIYDYDEATSILTAPICTEEKPEERKKEFISRCQSILNYMNLKSNDKIIIDHKKRIDASIEWAFDSLINQNETFSFIQSCIAIESIIGDTEKFDGKIFKIQNRIAYMLGKTEPERQELLTVTKNIFDMRNKLVHGSKPRLNRSEKDLLHKVQELLRRIILQECHFLQHDSP